MPLNLRSKHPPYVLFFMLYESCVVCILYNVLYVCSIFCDVFFVLYEIVFPEKKLFFETEIKIVLTLCKHITKLG